MCELRCRVLHPGAPSEIRVLLRGGWLRSWREHVPFWSIGCKPALDHPRNRERRQLATTPTTCTTLKHNHHVHFCPHSVEPRLRFQRRVLLECFDPFGISSFAILHVRPPPKKAERIRTNRSYRVSESRGSLENFSQGQHSHRHLSRAR